MPWCKNISPPPLTLHPKPECCPQRPASSLNLSHTSTIINMNGCSIGRVPAFMASRLLLWSQLKFIKRSRWSREFTQVSKVTSVGFYLSLSHMHFHSHTYIFYFLLLQRRSECRTLAVLCKDQLLWSHSNTFCPKRKKKGVQSPKCGFCTASIFLFSLDGTTKNLFFFNVVIYLFGGGMGRVGGLTVLDNQREVVWIRPCSETPCSRYPDAAILLSASAIQYSLCLMWHTWHVIMTA